MTAEHTIIESRAMAHRKLQRIGIYLDTST
jgi:hypothetical protein